MTNRRAFLSLILVVAATNGAVVAGALRTASSGPRPGLTAPSEYVPQIDGPMTTALGPGGRTWGAWAYRKGGEFDIAIAFRDAAGAWSSPSYVGRRDGVDEIEPALAVDENGTVFVAFTTRGSAGVSVSLLPAGSSTWFGPVLVSGSEPASSPAIRIVRDRLIVAYRTGAGIGIVELPLVTGPAQIFGIQDGPDGVDPLGMVPKWGLDPKHRDPDSQTAAD